MYRGKRIITTILAAGLSLTTTVSAFAGTANQEALKKYNSILSKSTFAWDENVSESNDTSYYKFALYDINRDGTKELFLENTIAAHYEGYADVLTYYKGKIAEQGHRNHDNRGGHSDAYAIYRKSGILFAYSAGMGYVAGDFYRLKNGKWIKLAHVGITIPEKGDDGKNYKKALTLPAQASGFKYDGCKINGKRVSVKKFRRTMKKKLGDTTSQVKLKYYKNTVANRAKYLK